MPSPFDPGRSARVGTLQSQKDERNDKAFIIPRRRSPLPVGVAAKTIEISSSAS